jgi:hypothetical protein
MIDKIRRGMSWSLSTAIPLRVHSRCPGGKRGGCVLMQALEVPARLSRCLVPRTLFFTGSSSPLRSLPTHTIQNRSFRRTS